MVELLNPIGDMVLGFSGSSETIYVSAFYTWRLANGTVPPAPMLFRKGEDYFNDTRWGDYSCTSLDPVDEATFWTVQEYARPRAPAPPEPEPVIPQWGTWVGNVIPSP